MMPMTKLNRLEYIDLDKNAIGSKGVMLLIKAEFPKLIGLSLRQCKLGNEGIKHLCKASWPRLRSL